MIRNMRARKLLLGKKDWDCYLRETKKRGHEKNVLRMSGLEKLGDFRSFCLLSQKQRTVVKIKRRKKSKPIINFSHNV